MNSPSSPAAAAAPFVIRDAQPSDFDAIQDIYRHHVLHGLATFEEVPPDAAELRTRHDNIVGQGLPYLVAVRDGQVLGYAYASAYRPRPAYRYTVEDSIYLAHDAGRQGLGAALLAALIQRCEQGPWRQMIAVIGNSENQGSIAVHTRLGFTLTGIQPNTGYKLGRWVDTVLMQRALGPGGSTPPGNPTAS
ncbi:GCN5-related N-acetyltransferase [plant metagenome]|uniref:GCN5-related N-acetyltransferase n=1 Tax=plant metagenome TaxID=1297885 RepID=A0A484V7K2_9ZZZZ